MTSQRTSHRTGIGITTQGGPDSGPPVVWVHGYTLDSSLWSELWELMPGFHHIGVDLPGHGSSAEIPSDMSLPAYAAAVAEVAHDYHATRTVALSFGTIAALQWAIDQPSSLTHLIVGAPKIAGGPSVPDIPAEPSAETRYRELALLLPFAGPGEQMTGLWMSSPPNMFLGTERHLDLRDRLRTVILRHQWTELANGAMGRMTSSTQTDDDLAGITAKTLVVIGDEDMPTFQANSKRLAEVVPGCQVETVVGAGHLVLVEQPHDVAAALTEHLLS